VGSWPVEKNQDVAIGMLSANIPLGSRTDPSGGDNADSGIVPFVSIGLIGKDDQFPIIALKIPDVGNGFPHMVIDSFNSYDDRIMYDQGTYLRAVQKRKVKVRPTFPVG
jgi:hypothetical protein